MLMNLLLYFIAGETFGGLNYSYYYELTIVNIMGSAGTIITCLN